MLITYHSDGVPGYIPTGFKYPIVTDLSGRCLCALNLHIVVSIATNSWGSEETARTYAQRVTDLLGYAEDNDIPFEKITVRTFTEFRNFKQKVGIDGVPCSILAVNQSIAAFKRFIAFACKHGYFVDDGLACIADYRPKTSGKAADNDIDLPTGEEIRAFMAVLRGPEERIALGLAFGAGMRRAEIVGLPADIIRPLGEMRHLVGSVMLVLDGFHAPTKGNKPRTIEVPIRLYSEMYNYKVSERRYLRASRAHIESPSLLLSKQGRQCEPGWLNDVCAYAKSLTGICIHPHLLRHWYATRFIEYDLHSRFGGRERVAYEILRRGRKCAKVE
jgi:integrase